MLRCENKLVFSGSKILKQSLSPYALVKDVSASTKEACILIVWLYVCIDIKAEFYPKRILNFLNT